MNGERKANAAVTAGILSLFIISYGVSYIQVIISELATAFPDIPVSSLSYIMAIAPWVASWARSGRGRWLANA